MTPGVKPSKPWPRFKPGGWVDPPKYDMVDLRDFTLPVSAIVITTKDGKTGTDQHGRKCRVDEHGVWHLVPPASTTARLKTRENES